MTDWHCSPELLGRYTDGRADLALQSSIEAHLLRCAECRALLAASSSSEPLQAAWNGIRETIQRPALPFPLRLLRRLGLHQEDAVLLSASRSMHGPWTLATVVVLVFAAVASFPGNESGRALYLLVAPLIPVLGVVAAFNADPTAEMVGATPYSKTRLALLRTAAVTVTTVPLVVLMGAIVPGMALFSVAWLGPALGLTLAALTMLTWLRPEVTGAVVSLGWTLVVGFAYGAHNLGSALDVEAQLAYLALAALTAAVLTVRIRTASPPGGYA